MSADAVGICVAIGLGLVFLTLGLGATVFLGLRSFTGGVKERLSEVKEDIVSGLSDIRDKMIRVETIADSVQDSVQAYIASRPEGTVVRELQNFGSTRIAAEPGAEDTTYTVRVEKGIINTRIMGKLSRSTGFSAKELEVFGTEPRTLSLGARTFRITLPSTDAKICTQYMSLFLKWLDTEYIKGQEEGKKEFEDGIEV